MKRLVTQKKNKNPGAYPKELRAFAMTLKFYSEKAYKYVRNMIYTAKNAQPVLA